MDIPSEKEQRRNVRALWLSAIQAFADTATQRQRWTDPDECNPAYSYVECMAAYFDDAYMAQDDAYARWVRSDRMTAEEAAAVADFHAVATAYNAPNGDDYNAIMILADPAWAAVTEQAQIAKVRLLELLKDQAERNLLTQSILWREDNNTFRADGIGATYVR